MFPELGLYYYKARMYSPTLGRFLQTDPVGYADQMNMYAYVGNDPVNYKDQTGMYKELVDDAVDYGKDKIKEKAEGKVKEKMTSQQRQNYCIAKYCRNAGAYMSLCILKNGCAEGLKENLREGLEQWEDDEGDEEESTPEKKSSDEVFKKIMREETERRRNEEENRKNEEERKKQSEEH